jgi:uncharacterized ubiquitin-like protein YukD
MAGEVKVKVATIGGEERDIETPLDIKTQDFIKELVIALKLPLMDAENHQISWRVDNKDTGTTLDGDKTLEENGVKEGHHLNLIRATVAGTGVIALL